jgi:hypothetical protein
LSYNRWFDDDDDDDENNNDDYDDDDAHMTGYVEPNTAD